MATLTKITPSAKVTKDSHKWHLVDGEKKILGRFATQVAELLIGKNKTNYSPEADCGENVVVINAQSIRVTGQKEDDKLYSRYSGYPGGLKQITLKQVREQKPTFILRHAILGMLPKNKLRKVRVRRLYIYSGADHPHLKEFSQ